MQTRDERSGSRLAALLAVGLAATAAIVVSPASPVSADVISTSDSTELASLPSSTTLELQQFDPALGTLTQLTVTATLVGDVSASVRNLGAVTRQTTVSFDASAEVSGPVVDAFTISNNDSTTFPLAGGATQNVALADQDHAVVTSSDPADLVAFSGGGLVSFQVMGSLDVSVSGPSAWQTKGSATAVATVEVDYEYSPGTTTTTTTPATTTTAPATTTTTPATTTTAPTTTTLPPTTTTLPPTTTTIPPTTTTLAPTTTTIPNEPPGCPPAFWGTSGNGSHWTGYNAGDSFNTVFGLTDPPHTDLSLGDALNNGTALQSNAVAALLNASHPDMSGFPYTPSQVISLTANALITGDGIEALVAQFAAANNGRCELS